MYLFLMYLYPIFLYINVFLYFCLFVSVHMYFFLSLLLILCITFFIHSTIFLLTFKVAIFVILLTFAEVSQMSSRLTSESRIYADKARDLNRQVNFLKSCFLMVYEIFVQGELRNLDLYLRHFSIFD